MIDHDDDSRWRDERLLSTWTGTVLPWCERCSCHHPPGACRLRPAGEVPGVFQGWRAYLAWIGVSVLFWAWMFGLL